MYKNKDQSLIKWAVLINRFLYSTTVQNFTHLSYSFCVTKPIIGAGRWHGPIKVSTDSNLIQGFVAAPVGCILPFFILKVHQYNSETVKPCSFSDEPIIKNPVGP